MSPYSPVRVKFLWQMIGTRIIEARQATGMSKVEFALTVRITRQALDLFEKGERGIRLETLYRIANVSGRPIADFLPPSVEL